MLRKIKRILGIPVEETFEETIMRKGGWKHIRDREKFDRAMMKKDSSTITDMFNKNRVPLNYFQRFKGSKFRIFRNIIKTD